MILRQFAILIPVAQTIFDAAGGQEAFLKLAQAIDDAGLPDDPRLRSTLEAYFRWATRRLARYPYSPDDVPVGIPLARWSWDGPRDH